MYDEAVAKEYLRAHGISDIDRLSYDEINTAYEKCIREGIQYFNDSLKENKQIVVEEEARDINADLDNVKNMQDMYEMIYEYLHFYSPSDVVAFLAESKFSINYKKLNKIVSIVHARVQDELLDKIALDLENLPIQERETLLDYYEKNREDVVFLEEIHSRFRSESVVQYVQRLADAKLEIVKTHLPKHLESEYKPYYDNTTEKKQLALNILNISSIYSKERLFDMTIHELNNLYHTIVEQNKQKEKQNRILKKYIEIFEDYVNISDFEFKKNVEDAAKHLSEESMQELIGHFEYKNHFIANKILNIIKINHN